MHAGEPFPLAVGLEEPAHLGLVGARLRVARVRLPEVDDDLTLVDHVAAACQGDVGEVLATPVVLELRQRPPHHEARADGFQAAIGQQTAQVARPVETFARVLGVLAEA